MMAGPGVPGDQVIAEQTRLILEAQGVPHEQAEKRGADEFETLALVKQEKDPAVLEKKLREKFTGKVPEAQIGEAILKVNSPWMRYFVNFDPATSLSKVTCPVLALNGEKDLQVPPKQNLPAVRQALEAAGNKHFEIVELPGLNHLFQTAKTGSPTEYARIEETIAPAALDKIATWILQQ
jgi:pimeloyl-ACP methyl ester carboxylesterase